MISYILRMIITSHSPYTLTLNWNDVIKTADNPVWSTLLSLKVLLRHCYRAYYIFIRIAGLVTNEIYHLLDGLNRFLKILHKTFATSGMFTTGNCRPHRINILCLFTSAPYNESFERELPLEGELDLLVVFVDPSYAWVFNVRALPLRGRFYSFLLQGRVSAFIIR